MRAKQYAKRVLSMAAAAVLTVSSMGVFTPAQAEQTDAKPQYPFMDTSLSFEERAADLVSRLTLDEKVTQLGRNTAAVSRLGLAKYDYWNEALHGIQNGSGEGTSYPMPLGLAQTWDEEFIKVVADAIADDARGHSQPTSEGGRGRGLTYWCPTVNLDRHPLWGRTNEAYGEDAYVAGMLASAFSEGMMGDVDVKNDGKYLKTVPTIKHYALNNHENGRGSTSSDANEADIRDYYTRVYRYIIERTDVPSLMSAYNAVNYTPSSGNTFLLDTLLRKTFGFTGFVTSDCGAIDNLEKEQKWQPAKNTAQADNYTLAPGKQLSDYVDGNGVVTKPGSVALALMAGCDMDCNGDIYPANAKKAVQAGILTEAQVNKNVYNNLLARFKLGEFDPDEMVEYRSAEYSFANTVETPEHTALAVEAANRSVVLLKNENNTLPLKANELTNIVIVGDNADVCWTGNYSGKPKQQHQISLYDGIKDYLTIHGSSATVEKITSFGENGAIKEADQEKIKNADVVIAFGSDVHEDSSEGHDREELKLTRNQNEIIKNTEALNENTIVYLQTSNMVEIKDFKDKAKAILWTTQNGEAQGTGAANQLFGATNPSGKLTFTWYKDEAQLPSIRQYGLKAKVEGENNNDPAYTAYTNGGFTYQYFTGDVEYPFGYGLSYTTYEYGQATIDKTSVDANDELTVKVPVTNTGDVAGSEVVQVYVKYPQADGMPTKQIKGFQKLDIDPGKTENAEIKLNVADFYFWNDTAKKNVVPTGDYTIEVGASSQDINENNKLKVTVNGKLAEKANVVTAVASDLTVNVGKTLTTDVTVSLKDDTLLEMGADKLYVKFESNKPEIASVDNNGVITGKAAGTATITVTASYNGTESQTTSFPVAVTSTVKASELKVGGTNVVGFDPDTTTYNVTGAVKTVDATVPDGVTKEVKTNDNVVTVTLTKGNDKNVYTVNFVDACDITAIEFADVKLSTKDAKSYTLNAKATTTKCTTHANPQVTYTYTKLADTTPKDAPATIENGVLEANGAGRVTVQVKATIKDGNNVLATKVASAQIWITDALDRSKLEEAIRIKVTGNDYEEESLNEYYKQLEIARKVFFDENATQPEIDKAYEDLMAVKKQLIDYSYVVAKFPEANKSYSMGSSNNIYINWEKVKNDEGKDTTADLTTHDSSKLELRFTITLTPSGYDTSFLDAINATGNWFKLRSTNNASKDFDPHKSEFGGPEPTNDEHNFGWAVSDYIKDWGTTEVVIPLEIDPKDGVEGHGAGLPVVSTGFCGDNKASSNLMDQTKYTSRGIIDWSQLEQFFGIINFKSNFAASNTVSAKLENVRVVDRTFEEESEKLTAELDKKVDVDSCSDDAKKEAYNKAVAAAEEALTGNNALAIMKANTALVKARDALGVTVTVNKDALKAAYDARLTDEDNVLETSTEYKRYTDASWAAYQEIVAAADALLKNAEAEQLSVNKVTAQLKNADSILQLTKVSSYVVATLLSGEKSVEAHYLSVAANADLDLSKDKDHTVTVRYDIKVESTWTNPAPMNEGWLKLVRNGKARFWSTDETPTDKNVAATQYNMNCEKDSVMSTYGPSGTWMTIVQDVPAEVLADGKLTRFEVFMYNDTAAYQQAPADEGIDWNNDTGVKMTVRNIQVMSDMPRDDIPLDTIPLQTSIEEAKTKNLKVYTDSSVKDLEEALQKAEAVMAKENKTQKEINDAKSALDKALANLKPKREGDSTDSVTFSASNGTQTTLQDGTQFYVDWKAGDGLANDDVDGNGADLSGTAANGASKELALRMNIRYGLMPGAEGDPATCWKMLFLRLRSGRIGGSERACEAIVLSPSDVTAKADGSYDIEIPLSRFVTKDIDWTDVRQLIIRSELFDESQQDKGHRVDSKTYTMTVTDARIEPINDTPAVKYGDVDGDKDVDIIDALMALQKAAGKIELDEPKIARADVDGKAGVTAADALLILKVATRQIAETALPVK